MSQYNNIEYAQTEYQQYDSTYDNSYYGGYDNYNNNYYNNQPVNNNSGPPAIPKRGSGERMQPRRPAPPPINSSQSMMNQSRPSPQFRPINSSMRQSPPIRPNNNANSIGVRQSPQVRPINQRPPPPRNMGPPQQQQPLPPPLPLQQQQRPPVPRPMNNNNMQRSSPQVSPTNSISSFQSLPPRPLQSPPVAPVQRNYSTPQVRARNNSIGSNDTSLSSPNLPLRSQSSLSNVSALQKQMARQPLPPSGLSNSNTFEENAYDPPIPPRTRQHRGASISSQGSTDSRITTDSSQIQFSARSHSLDNTQNNQYDQSYDYNTKPAPLPTPPIGPVQYNNSNIPNQNNNYYNYNNNNPMQSQPQPPRPSNPTQGPPRPPNPTQGPQRPPNPTQGPPRPPNPNQGPARPPNQPQRQNYSYNSNIPINFHPQAMYNGIGNQYRPPPVRPKAPAINGKLPMTSLGGQPMPYGQSLEMYRQNAKKSNDPHVQLEFAKYLIAMADAAMDSDPDQKVAQRNQEILYNEGLKWIKKLASQGGGLGKTPYAEAQFFLAECYGNGSIGLQIDHEKAFSYYLQASKQSHPPSTYRAAVCYEYGAGTKKDHQRAVQFYRKAAALGDVLSMYKLGIILLNGTLNQDKNPREGLTWLKRAAAQADQTCPHALHELGLIYEGKNPETNGLIIPDPNYSQELYLKAAQYGYAPSQYKLGLCYEYGLLNLPVDSRRSIAWYSKAAEQGDPEAELALSGWYLTGADNVLKQSDKEAFLWARKAANKGLAKAEYAVGYYYENGIGVKKDLEEAKRSYLSAASQNNKRALVRLKEMKAGYASRGQIYGWREQSRGTGAASEDCVIS